MLQDENVGRERRKWKRASDLAREEGSVGRKRWKLKRTSGLARCLGDKLLIMIVVSGSRQ